MNYKSESGCKCGDCCHFRHTEACGQPVKSKNSGGKGSVALLTECSIGMCSQDSFERKSILRENEKLKSNYTTKFSKTTMCHAKIRETKGPSQRFIQKCEPQERVPWAPKFEERTQNEILRQERWARKAPWNLAKDFSKLKKESQGYVLLSCQSLGNPGTLFDKSTRATIRNRV